uniref:inositol 1,4,5-triphosphate receptor associated 1 n=1 Tax=Pristiophorus japonicus TaxID=55135 RepID=UPI00398F08EB
TKNLQSDIDRKQEPDVWPLSQEILVQFRQQSLGIYTGLCTDHGSSGLHTPLLDALNLEHFWSRQPFGSQKQLRPLSLGQSQAEREELSASKEPLTEDRDTKSTSSPGSSPLREGVEHRRSAETDTEPPAPAISEEEDWAEDSPLRALLSRFALPGRDPSCHSAGSLTRSPHCIVPPGMPTLPEEEEGAEDQARMQGSSFSVRNDERQNCTCVVSMSEVSAMPAIVLPEVSGSSDRDFDQTTQIRSHSPTQRRSSRNSRTSLSSTSSLTSVDGNGHVYDLVNDELPDVELSDEDKKKNAELLGEAKKLSEKFLMRRCRRSRNSTSDSPPALTPTRTPIASPSPSRSNSVTVQPQIGSDTPAANCAGTTVVISAPAGEKPPPSPNRDKERKLLEVPGTREKDVQLNVEKHARNLSPARKVVEGGKSSPVARACHITPSAELADASVQRRDPASPGTDTCGGPNPLDKNGRVTADPSANTNGAQGPLGSPSRLRAQECKVFPLRPSLLTVSESASLKGTEPAAARPRVPCRAEIKSFSSQPLLRAVSWECMELEDEQCSPPQSPTKAAESFSFGEVFDSSQLKASDGKDPPAQPKTQKLAKLREENKLMRSQNLSALRLPDLSETIEQDRGPSPTPGLAAHGGKGSSGITPNIPDSLLRKLKVHRSLPGGLPPLTEKEIENTFIQLSLAFKNDSYTLETRLGLAERERNLAEDNTEKELENFKTEMKTSTSLWVHSDHRDAHQRLLETIGVLQRLAIRLSGRAEMVGAVRQEKRMSKATEVMMQYVENLKRMYEKDHAELTEFKKLANQNSSRSYGPYGDSGDDGIPRTARSMSLTLGKTMPRRRVSVAVVPKFINFPGHPPSSSAVPTVATMPEASNNTGASSSDTVTTPASPSCSIATPASPTITSLSSINPSSISPSRISMHSSPTLAPLAENGKQNGDEENELASPGAVQPVKVEIPSSETKAKIEEEAYNKGYQEGLKAQLSQEQKEDPEKAEGQNTEEQSEPSFKEERKNSKFEEVSERIDRLCPKCLKHRSAIWVVGAVVLLFAILISIFTSLRYPRDDLSNTPGGKSSSSSLQKYLWPFSGSRHKNRAQA